ncbi:hypothetical protein GQ53DRAFT_836744 [Thozetella sp. PMI_491]|nr:hypothetical protein GQ53DRAFT_836744 [Thozetella sp. PMI_491]
MLANRDIPGLSAVHLLAEHYDEERARDLIPALNQHLKYLRSLLTKSKSLTRDVQYRITATNERTNKALSVDSVDLAPVNQVCQTFRDDVDGFWAAPVSRVHTELRRRLACVVVFLRSKLDAEVLAPPRIARLFPEQVDLADIRNSGRKYVKIARKLGGVGAVFWLPLNVPPSTYERYLNIDDEQVFAHLISLGARVEQYTNLVQRLVLTHLRDPEPPLSYYNLAVDYDDWLPASDQLLLVLHALGGSGIPEALLKGVRSPQRRWNAEGEIECISASESGLPEELIRTLSEETAFSQVAEDPSIVQSVLEGHVVSWTLRPDTISFFIDVLLPRTVEVLGDTALRLICFACPPCYEGNTTWPISLKQAVWPILESATRAYKIPKSLRIQVLEAILFFGERDSVAIRRFAVEQARSLLQKSMPYYLHASVVLFQSVLLRIDGELDRSKAQIESFMWRGPKPSSRRDHALQGRLHISQIENKIKCYDNDVPFSIYKWEAEHPLSSLDIEVMFRLQSTAARFFQSVGDFGAARASLEQFLCLDTTKPIRLNTRRILVGRLADIYCEMQEYARAAEMSQPELSNIDESDRPRRGFRRLLLASVEANIGLGKLAAADSALREMEPFEPRTLDDLHDQQLHMRMLLSAARIAHMQPDLGDAVARWQLALQEVERMYTLKSERGFTAAVIHLSLAHAQLNAGDVGRAKRSWAIGLEILRSEKCEFWIPTVSTLWLPKIALGVYESQGWTFHMMLPGGKSDITYP